MNQIYRITREGGKTKMTEQITNWLNDEAQAMNQQQNFDGEKLPAIQFEEGKIVKFTVDFSAPFNTYDDQENKVLKAIIPVEQNGEKKILWLNRKNPLYHELIVKGATGQVTFSVLQTGNKANTKYNLITEEAVAIA